MDTEGGNTSPKRRRSLASIDKGEVSIMNKKGESVDNIALLHLSEI